MLSRVASSIYRSNRYIKRAENYARFIEVNLSLTLDLSRGTTEQWEPLGATTGDHENCTARYVKATKETVIRFLSSDAVNANSILSCLVPARQNARSVREIISTDMWEQVNCFHLMVRSAMSKGLSGYPATISTSFCQISKPPGISFWECPPAPWRCIANSTAVSHPTLWPNI